MALSALPPNPLVALTWNDGYTVTAEKIRSFKTYLVGNNFALISADAVKLVRARYGNAEHQKTTKTGSQISLYVDPPEQTGNLDERIKQTSFGYLLREDYEHALFPNFRFFVKIKEEDDWQTLCGEVPLYGNTFPYPRVVSSTPPPPLVVTTSRKTLWFEKVKSLMRNTSTHPVALIFGTATWAHSFLFLGKKMWFPAVSVLVLSVALYQGWQVLGKALELLPTLDNVKATGWEVLLVVTCLLAGWFIYSVANYSLTKWYRGGPLSRSRKPDKDYIPPTESSPSTSFYREERDACLESLCFEDTEGVPAELPASVTDAGLAQDTGKYQGCVADGLFLVGEFTMPLSDEVCPGTNLSAFLVLGGDFVLGQKAEGREHEPFVSLCDKHGADYLLWLEQMTCMWEGCLKKGLLWEREGMTQRWCAKHLQHVLFQGENVEPGENTVVTTTVDPRISATATEPSVTPPRSGNEISVDQVWLETFDDYREENEK